MKRVIDYSELTLSRPRLLNGVKHCHKLALTTYEGSQWFVKEFSHPAHAKWEAIAQEIFRLFLPNQPRTRIARDPDTNVHYVLSENIPGYRQLPSLSSPEIAAFTSGKYHGLGGVLILSLFLQEVDLKNGNIGLNDRNQVIKIDSEWCFASLQDPRRFPEQKSPITPSIIQALPDPLHYFAYNWLSYQSEGRRYHLPLLENFKKALQQCPSFHTEMYQAILKILLTPTSAWQRLIDAHLEAGSEQLLHFINERQQTLQACTEQLKAYQDYLLTEDAEQIMENYPKQLDDFLSAYPPPVSTTRNSPSLRPFTVEERKYQQLLTELQNKSAAFQVLAQSDRKYQRIAFTTQQLHMSLTTEFDNYRSRGLTAERHTAFLQNSQQAIMNAQHLLNTHRHPKARMLKELLLCLAATLTGIGLLFYGYGLYTQYQATGQLGFFQKTATMQLAEKLLGTAQDLHGTSSRAP